MSLHKRSVGLTQRQLKELEKEATEIGISLTELLRRILDSHIESRKSPSPDKR